MQDEEKASFRFGGTRARPRKGIEGSFLTGQVYLKPPGSCAGRWPDLSISIEVECCKNCEIYILDPCAQVQVADCRNCRIIIAPCSGSVFLLDCIGCRVTVAAKQLRLRDMRDCELRTFAPTQESNIIETSTELRFGCWDVAYPGLGAQVAALGWDPAVNHWSRIYDFSPSAADSPANFELMPAPEQAARRWSELSPNPEGLCGGQVEEVCGENPSVAGCECPFAAADGTLYTASWYTPQAAAAPPPAVPLAVPSAVPPAVQSGAAAATALPAPPAEERSVVERLLGWLTSVVSGLFGGKVEPPAAGAPLGAHVPKAIAPGTTSTTSTSCAVQ